LFAYLAIIILTIVLFATVKFNFDKQWTNYTDIIVGEQENAYFMLILNNYFFFQVLI